MCIIVKKKKGVMIIKLYKIVFLLKKKVFVRFKIMNDILLNIIIFLYLYIFKKKRIIFL